MTDDRSLIAWARELPSGARVSWATVEARAFRRHRRVLAQLGDAGASQRRAEWVRNPWVLTALVLAALPALAMVLMPVIAFAVLGGNDLGLVIEDSAVAIRIAGWLMVVCAVSQAAILIRALLGRSLEDLHVSGWIAAVMGSVVALSIAVRGALDGVPDWPTWASVAFLAAILGVVVTVRARRARRRIAQAPPGPAVRTASRSGPEVAARRASAVAAIPPRERERIRAELTEAIGVLRRRGIVTPEEASAAAAAELGRLALRMEP